MSAAIAVDHPSKTGVANDDAPAETMPTKGRERPKGVKNKPKDDVDKAPSAKKQKMEEKKTKVKKEEEGAPGSRWTAATRELAISDLNTRLTSLITHAEKFDRVELSLCVRCKTPVFVEGSTLSVKSTHAPCCKKCKEWKWECAVCEQLFTFDRPFLTDLNRDRHGNTRVCDSWRPDGLGCNAPRADAVASSSSSAAAAAAPAAN